MVYFGTNSEGSQPAGTVKSNPENYGYVYAADSSDGSVQWKTAVGSVTTTPTVVDGTVYVGTDGRTLYALDAETGTVDWDYDIGVTNGKIFSDPVVSDGVVYFGYNSAEANGVLAVDTTNVDNVWRFTEPNQVLSGGAINGDTLYISSNDSYLYSIDVTTGTENWRYQADNQIRRSDTTYSDGTVFVGATDNKLHAVNADTGNREWTFSTGDIVQASPTVTDSQVIFGSYDGRIYSVDKNSGGEIWRFKTGGTEIRSGALVGDVYYVGVDDGVLYALEASSGEELWRLDLGGFPRTPVVSNTGTIYVRGTDSQKRLFALGDVETETKSPTKETETKSSMETSQSQSPRPEETENPLEPVSPSTTDGRLLENPVGQAGALLGGGLALAIGALAVKRVVGEDDSVGTASTSPGDVHGRSVCPDCGGTLDGSEKYCTTCGYALLEERCPDCETELDGDEKFCPECGYDLSG